MTAFMSLVGCRLPLQQAGMSGVATPDLARAVASTGALGMLGIGRQPMAMVQQYVKDVAGADGVIGCTFIEPFVTDDVVEMVASHLDVVEFFYGWPTEARAQTGRVCGWQVGTVDEARAAADAGCRYVIAQGREAGGHVRGVEPFERFLADVRAAVSVPVVAAGGIATRADVNRALGLGADAVRIGTRFAAAVESNAHPYYVDALINAGTGDTVLTEAFGVGWPDAPHRVLRSAIAAATAATDDQVGTSVMTDGRVSAMPRFGASLPTKQTTGNIGAMALYAGTSVGAVTRRQTAAEVVAELTAGLAGLG
jgi:nitronate monooxygenase